MSFGLQRALKPSAYKAPVDSFSKEIAASLPLQLCPRVTVWKVKVLKASKSQPIVSFIKLCLESLLKVYVHRKAKNGVYQKNPGL